MGKIIVGLTGGIASGKSTVSGILANLGAYIIDADKISREITEKGSKTLVDIEKTFPGTVKNGVLDRKALKNTAFSSKEKIERLNSITHPAIFEHMRADISRAPDGVVILDVPLLFETGAESLCEKTITVSCDTQIRINRLLKRDNIDEALAKNILSKQMSDAQREQRADYVVRNDSDLEGLTLKVEELYRELEKLR